MLTVIQNMKTEVHRVAERRVEKRRVEKRPISKLNWDSVYEIPFDAVRTQGSWFVEREVFIPYFEERLVTYAPHNSMSFEFEGRGLMIVFNYGKTSGKIEYRIDGGEWCEYAYERYWWVPEENFTNAVKFADDLAYGHHTFALRVTHGDKEGFTSSDCRILKIMAVK